MDKKLLSVLLAVVMVSSACIVPFASEGADADDGVSNIKDGDVYGVYLDLTFDKNGEKPGTIAKLFGSLNSMLSGLSEKELITYLNGYFAEMGITLNDLFIDIELGFAIKQTAANTYEIRSIADGSFRTDATMIDSAVNYIGEVSEDADIDEFIAANSGSASATKAVTEVMKTELNIQFGLSLDVVTNDDGEIVSVDGIMGREFSSTITKKTLEDNGEYSYLVSSNSTTKSSVYINLDMLTSGNNPTVSVTWFLVGDLLGLDDVMGPYGNYICGVDDIEIELPIDTIDGFVGATNEILKGKNGSDGFITLVELLNIIDITPVSPILRELIVTMLPEDLKESFQSLIIGEDQLSLTDLWSLVSALPNVGDLVEMLNLDAIPYFIFGTEDFKLTDGSKDSEYTKIDTQAESLANKSITGLKNKNVTVEFYDDIGGERISTIPVKFGQGIAKDDAIKGVENDAKRGVFIGWFALNADGEFYTALPTDLSKIYGNLKVAPVFAKKVADLSALYGALTGADKELFAEITEETVDTSKFKDAGKTVHVSVSDSGLVKSIVWTFVGAPENNDGSALGNVNIKFTSEDKGETVKINFQHNGSLPVGTYVTIDLDGKFKAGTVLNVYHEKNGKLDLVDGMAIVDENGKVKVALEHCSSYVLEVNQTLTNFEEPDDDDGFSIFFIIGIAVGVLIVIGIGVFIILKRRN